MIELDEQKLDSPTPALNNWLSGKHFIDGSVLVVEMADPSRSLKVQIQTDLYNTSKYSVLATQNGTVIAAGGTVGENRTRAEDVPYELLTVAQALGNMSIGIMSWLTAGGVVLNKIGTA